MSACYDIHAHLADSRIVGNAESILSASAQQGVRGILVNAARVEEWPTVVRLASYPAVYGALGLHPFFIGDWEAALPDRLKAAILAAGPRIRAVGEIGLDFCHGREWVRRQIGTLEAQLGVAGELGLPVILHNRKSWPEFLAVWRSCGHAVPHGVCHHFTGGREMARQLLDLGLFISFCGPLTYPNARRLKETAEYVPLERVLTETDAPDLPAQPYRGGFSYPWQVSVIVDELARLKSRSREAVAEQVERNFRTVLRLPSPAGQAS